MSGAAGRRAVSSWAAEDRLWYLDMVAHADGGFCTADTLPTALHRYDSLQWDQCILLEGDGYKQILDARGALWSDDKLGRWFETRSKPMVRLHQVIGQLCYGGRRAADGDVVSHICGNCNCIRAEHIIYQSKREDLLDKAYHKRFWRGCIRSKHMPKDMHISSPVSVIHAGPV